MLFENPPSAATKMFPYAVPPPVMPPMVGFADDDACRREMTCRAKKRELWKRTRPRVDVGSPMRFSKHQEGRRRIRCHRVPAIDHTICVVYRLGSVYLHPHPIEISDLARPGYRRKWGGSTTMVEGNGLLDAHHHDVQITSVGINGSHSGSSGRSTPSGQNGGVGDPAPGKLFVGGLSWQTSSEKLKEYFGMFGNVTDVLIMKDPVTQRSRGFGFITFSEPSSVEKVLKVPIHTLDGKKIDPKHATPKNRPKQPNKTKKIFVGGVSQDTSADEVKAYFSQFGKVEETVMLMDQQTKRHRGFGFVTFENEDVVDRVCEIHFHTIKNKKVECKKAQPKEAVQASAQLLGKRLMLSGLGVRLPAPVAGAVGGVNPLAAMQQPLAHVQAAAAAAAAAQAQSAAVAGYGKLLYPHLASYRYSPYPMQVSGVGPAGAGGNPNAPQGPAPGAQMTAAPQITHSPYQGYNLTNVDMSSFQGVDWGAMYGVGMYV